MKLGELIEMRKRALGHRGEPLSYEDLAERARSRGHSITRATIHGLATDNRPLQATPKRPTLEALAAALDVAVADVALAAVESMGVDLADVSQQVTNRSHVATFVTLTGERSDEQVRHILRIAQAAAAALDEVVASERQHASPDAPPGGARQPDRGGSGG